MEAKVGVTQNFSYDDFEPFSNWRREVGRDTLVVHLPDFKKEQLNVQITKSGTLKVSGERPVDATTRSRFYKEYKVPSDCNADEIHAKFSGGLLNIIMPKRIVVAPTPRQPTSFHQTQANQNPNQYISPTAVPSQNITNGESKTKTEPSRFKRFGKVAMTLAVGVALVTALGAYIMRKYNSTEA